MTPKKTPKLTVDLRCSGISDQTSSMKGNFLFFWETYRQPGLLLPGIAGAGVDLGHLCRSVKESAQGPGTMYQTYVAATISPDRLRGMIELH